MAETLTSAAPAAVSPSSAQKQRGGGSAPGLRFKRHFTRPGVSPFDEITWEKRDAVIQDWKGKLIFEQKDVDVPSSWSMTATNIVASKYLHGRVGSPERESGVRALITRVAESIRDWGLRDGYFASTDDAEVFFAELSHMLLHQKVAFNSPVWFNVGCDRLEPNSDAQNWHWDAAANKGQGETVFSKTGYTRPQCSACFINSVNDSLDSILTLAKTEGMLFKWGSGAGSNLSAIRGSMELLSGGGTASGPLSFMRGFDAFAGVIKSGGKTRRAAKMVILNVDHPDIEDFVQCKVKEEKKAWTLMEAGYDGSGPDSEAFTSIFFQNANNSVRVTDQFMNAVERDGDFTTRAVKDGAPVKTRKARDLMHDIAEATWQCGDPGMQYDTTINRWHTSKNSARINASNPCSEYMFLDDSACNLASFNLLKFLDPAGRFDIAAYRHGIAILTTAMEIIVDAAGYPTEQISRNSHDYRPLGLGYANLGALLMDFGLPYDSDAGRAFAATLTAILCGDAYAQSARIAADCPPLGAATPLTQSHQTEGGACPGFYVNREPFLDVIRMHRAEVNNIGKSLKPSQKPSSRPERPSSDLSSRPERPSSDLSSRPERPSSDLSSRPEREARSGETPVFVSARAEGTSQSAIDAAGFAVPTFTDLKAAAQSAWDDALTLGEQHGYRNSQTTVLAPTGTIGFMMDCDTTGIEPDLALVKYKKLVGGGMIKIVNNTVPGALFKLGYTDAQVQDIVSFIDATGTIEGAPGLKTEHLPVFDCSFKPAKGSRTIAWLGHVRMMAATQPFLSGAISKTVNLPNDCTVAEIADAYTEAWRLGLKAVAIYRDGSKGTQPLNVSAEKDKKADATINTAPVAAGQTEIAETIAAEKALTAQALTDARTEAEAARHHIALLTDARDRIGTRLAAVESQLNVLLANQTADPNGNIDHRDQQGPPRAIRHRLPAERASLTHKFGIAGHEGYVTVGLYPNNCPGEIFIRMAKEGSTISGLMDSFATAISLALQHGVPLKVLAEKFAHTRFEPSGWTGNEEIGYAKSIMDYLFRWMQLRFLSGHQLSLFGGLNPSASGSLSADSPLSTASPLSAANPLSAGTRPFLATADSLSSRPEAAGRSGETPVFAPAQASPSHTHTIPVAGHVTAPDNTVTLTDKLEQEQNPALATSAAQPHLNPVIANSAAQPHLNPVISTGAAQPRSGETPAFGIPDYADRTPPAHGIAPDLAARSGMDTNGAAPSLLSSSVAGSASSLPADRGIFHAATAMQSLYDMGDAPSCSTCGAIMTRNGSCYRCMECGSTSGCS